MPMKFQISKFVWTSMFFGIFATLANYQFGGNDQIEQLPILYRTLDPNYLSNDFFTNNTSGFSPRFYYSKFIGFLSYAIGIPWVFFLGTLLSNIATATLSYLIGKRLFSDTTAGVFAAALVMFFPTIALGGDQVFYASLFTPTTLVFPLILLSFYLLLQKRIVLSLMITGIVSLFHILIGLEYGILFLSMLIVHEYLEHRDFKKVLKRSSLFFILILFLLPNLVPHLQNKTSIESSIFIEILAHFRHPHHYLLSEIMTLKEVGRFVLITLVILLTLGDWKAKIRSLDHQRAFQITAALLSIAALLGWIFVELIPSKLITSLQLLRMLNFGKWLFLLMVANHFAVFIKNKKFNPRTILVISLLGLLSFASDISWQKTFLIAMIYGFVLYVLSKGNRVALFTSIALFVGFILVINNSDYSPIKKYEKKYLSPNYLTTNQSKLTEFIRQNTASEAVFLSPHLFGFIRTEAQRAIVADFKAFPFKETAMLEWYHRIEDCYGLEKEAFEKVYKSLDDRRIQELQKKYDFNYAILYQETETKIPVIYANSEYKIIDLTSNDQ